jgi:hypothetical protein
MGSRLSSHRCIAVIRIRDQEAGAGASNQTGSTRSKQAGPIQCRHARSVETSASPVGTSAPESEEASGALSGVDNGPGALSEKDSALPAVARGLIVTPLPRPQAEERDMSAGARDVGVGQASCDQSRPTVAAGDERKTVVPDKPRQDDLDVTSWLAFAETLIDRPDFEGEATLIAGTPLTKSQAAALRRWTRGMRPSLWSADRFLTKLREPHHIDEYFDFCERRSMPAWARGFPPRWMTEDRPALASWTDEIEDTDPIWRASDNHRKRQLVQRRQALLARLEAEGGALWWRGPARQWVGPRDGDESTGSRG